MKSDTKKKPAPVKKKLSPPGCIKAKAGEKIEKGDAVVVDKKGKAYSVSRSAKPADTLTPGKGTKALSVIDQQERFVDEYLIDYNGTQAAIRAGYSPKTAYSKACSLLRKVEVQKALTEKKAAIALRNGLDQDKFARRMNELMDFDSINCYDGAVARDIDQIPKSTRVCLKGHKVTTKIVTRTVDGKEVQDVYAEHEFKYPDPLDVCVEYGKACGAIGGDDPGKLQINAMKVEVIFV